MIWWGMAHMIHLARQQNPEGVTQILGQHTGDHATSGANSKGAVETDCPF